MILDAADSQHFNFVFSGNAAQIRPECSCMSGVIKRRRSLVLKTQCIKLLT